MSRSRTPGGTASSNGRTSRTAFFMAGLLARSSKACRALSNWSGGLTIDYAGRSRGSGHQFGAVASAGAHIENLHAGAGLNEIQHADRIAPLVILPVSGAAIRRRHKRL